MVQNEGSECSRLKTRVQSLRRESQALRTGAQASKDGHQKIRESITVLETTAASDEQRLRSLRRAVSELQEEISILSLSLSATQEEPDPGTTDSAQIIEHTGSHGDDDVVRATNRKLQAKLAGLWHEVHQQRDRLIALRAQTADRQIGPQ